MGKLTVAEAIPRRVIKYFRIIKCILILGCCIFLIFFTKKESEIISEYIDVKAYQEKLSEYKHILQKAKQYYESGDLQNGETLYLQIMSEKLIDTEPYLGLADIYCDSKMYDDALIILESYPEVNNSEIISEKISEIKRLMESLEQSNFLPVE